MPAQTIVLLDAAGVHEAEGMPFPVDFGIVPVAGDPRAGIDQGVAATGQAVEQGGFAHVGAADQGDKGDGVHGALKC